MGIKGAILGDIAGSIFEKYGKTPKIKQYRATGDYELYNEDSCFTDDTIMSIAIKLGIIQNKPFEEAMVFLGKRYPDVGYGATFYNWIFADEKKMDDDVWELLHPGEPQTFDRAPYNSYGNGSAMRVSFVGEYLKDESNQSVVEDLATKTALVTHNHPEGIKGAVTIAVCVWMAERGKSKEEIFKYALSQYSSPEYEFGCDVHTNIYKENMYFHVDCMRSVPVAIRCFYETSSFEECMRLINSMECDADTIGAMAGAICESYYGSCFTKEKDANILKHYLTPELYKIAMF